MNILLLTTHLNIGGITIYTVSLAKALSKMGHRVAVASSAGELVKELENAGILHINIPIKTKSILSPAIFFSALKLRSMLYALGSMPDIIHSQTRVANVVSLYLAKFLRIPFVTTCHGFFRNNFGRRLFPNWGGLVIAISRPVRQHLIGEFGLNEKKIRYISNGIDTSQFSESLDEEEKLSYKQKLGIPAGSYCIGVISRLVKMKGQDYFLRAFAKLVTASQLSVSALLAGEGEAEDDLKNLAKALGISDKVIFAGNIYPTITPLSVMDILVFSSIGGEGFGLSILEAMAMGVAVVAFDTGGVTDIMQSAKRKAQSAKLNLCEGGILVKPKDIDGLCEAMLMLLQDADLRKRMGEAGRRIVRERFSIEKTARQTCKVYEEAIEDFKNHRQA